MSPPTISIITPSLNQSRFLEENIRSVLRQHYPAIEHIVVDGGSTDETLDLLKKSPHLRWISEPDRGQAHAVNKGFRMATGEILGWINSDDGYCENILADVARCFDDPAVMVVYGDGVEVDSDGNIIRSIVPRGITTEQFIKYWMWQYEYIQASFFFRRSVLVETGYLDESLFYTMDHDFFIRLSRRFRFHYLPKSLAFFRLHEASKTGATHRSVIPRYIPELHKVSMRYWGNPKQWRYYRHLFSFLGAIVFSLIKNVLFVPGSKSRAYVERSMHRGK